MASKLSFKDINITFKKHPVTNDLVVSRDASAIKQAIVNLLMTNKGERVYQPEYGSDLRKFLFEPMDFATAAAIQSNIISTLKKFEPRIGVQTITAIPNFDDNGFDCEMVYVIRGSDVPPVKVDFFLPRTR